MNELPAGGMAELLDEVMGSSCPELSLVSVAHDLYILASLSLSPTKVADEVFMYVDRSSQHGCLLGTPHFPGLVQYLISTHSITSLLHQTLNRGRYILIGKQTGCIHTLTFQQSG